MKFEKENGEYVVYLTSDLIASLINNKGTYHMTAEVTDKAGNSASIEKTAKVDIVDPVLTISGIKKDKHYNLTPSLYISTNEKFYMMPGAKITVNVTRDGSNIIKRAYTGTNKFTFRSFKSDGNYTVKVTENDAAGNTAVPRTVSFVKDTTAPVIDISGVTEGKFYNRTVHPTVTIKERYYKDMKVKIEMTRTLHGKTVSLSFPFSPSGTTSSHSVSLKESGEYHIKVTAVDRAGNEAVTKKVSFKVDTKAPKVDILGVKENAIYGYDDIVAPEIIFKDDYLDKYKAELIRGDESWYGNLAKTEAKGRIAFADFAKKKKNDGVYTIGITVSDKAGNVTREYRKFYVNRYGSTFSYQDDVEEYNHGYFQHVVDDLHIDEYNVGGIKSTKNILKRDGETVSVTKKYKETDRFSGYRVYEHTFKSDKMEKEGVYTLNVISKDSAGNTSESAQEAGEIRIVVDRTKPTITTEGLESHQVKGKSLTFTVEATDLLSPVKTKVELNGVKIKPKKKSENTYEIPEGFNQEIVITATDEAGNESVERDRITVTTNSFLYALSKYWPLLLAGLLGILGAVTGFIIYAARYKPKHTA